MRKRWWLFHATNFQTLMYPCFTTCRALGMFPYNINVSTFATSRPQYILSAAIACICCIIHVIIIRDFVTCKITLGTTTRDFEGVCCFTCFCFIVTFTLVLSGPRMRLLQTVLEISSTLPTKLYQSLSRLIHTKDILGTILIIMNLFRYYSWNKTMNDANVLFKVFSVYCVLLMFHLNMLYVNCTWILKACFKSINDKLTHIQRLAGHDTIRCSPTSICYVRGNQFLLIKLEELERQHLTVSDAVKRLNVIFSPLLLATVVTVFSNVTFELYYFAVRWQNGSVLVSFDNQLFEFVTCCIIYHFTLLALLIWACETCKNEACEIRTVIHDSLNNIVDGPIKDELHRFSLQTLHCRNIFAAKGLTIDRTLVGKMAGSITTYTLILVQFLIALHSCDARNP